MLKSEVAKLSSGEAQLRRASPYFHHWTSTNKSCINWTKLKWLLRSIVIDTEACGAPWQYSEQKF